LNPSGEVRCKPHLDPMSDLGLLRLLQLASPNLPTGAFAYSQGIEWAVESGWIRDGEGLADWIGEQIDAVLTRVDLPLLVRCRAACDAGDPQALGHWVATALAWRETAELRAEERARGRALTELLIALGVPDAAAWRATLAESQIAGFALAAARWEIPPGQAALGLAWTWLEGQVLAGVKLVPLGQTEGQRLLLRLAARLPQAVGRGLELGDLDIGASLPALAIASAAHETQYTRLFRS
jgi:urease accessory protein